MKQLKFWAILTWIYYVALVLSWNGESKSRQSQWMRYSIQSHTYSYSGTVFFGDNTAYKMVTRFSSSLTSNCLFISEDLFRSRTDQKAKHCLNLTRSRSTEMCLLIFQYTLNWAKLNFSSSLVRKHWNCNVDTKMTQWNCPRHHSHGSFYASKAKFMKPRLDLCNWIDQRYGRMSRDGN